MLLGLHNLQKNNNKKQKHQNRVKAEDVIRM